jgi:hypothetical protein
MTSLRGPPPRTTVRLPPPIRTLTFVRDRVGDVLSLRVVVWLRVVVLWLSRLVEVPLSRAAGC